MLYLKLFIYLAVYNNIQNTYHLLSYILIKTNTGVKTFNYDLFYFNRGEGYIRIKRWFPKL